MIEQHPAAYWASSNPVLAFGVTGYELDTGLSKLGDGTNAWNALAYADPPTEYSVASGTNTYVVTFAMPRILAYFTGLRLRIKFTNANTGASTLNLNGLGAKAIKKNVVDALIANDIDAGGIYELVYDGIDFQMQGGGGGVVWGTITGTLSDQTDLQAALDAAEADAKAYADALVVGLWDDRGNYDASGNTYPAAGGSGVAGAILKGDIWTISVAGVLGGVAVAIGDTVRALVDAPAQVSTNWAIAETNIGYIPENQVNKDTDGALSANSDVKYPSQKAVKTYADTKQPLDSDLTTIAGLTATTDNFIVSVGSAWASRTPAQVKTTLAFTRAINITIDGQGGVCSTGLKGFVTIPFSGTITGWYIFGDQAGSCVVDVWKDTYANFPPVVGDTIAGTEKPTLASAQKNQDEALSTWTVAVTAGDVIAFNLDSCTTLTRINLLLKLTEG